MRKINMKTVITLIAISLLFFLASCRATIQAPQIMDRTPDVLKKSTQTTVNNPTVVDIPKDTLMNTGDSKRVTVVLEDETRGSVPQGLFQLGTPKELLIPKNTEVTLPPNTPLRTIAPIKVTMESGAEVTLPAGTEITVTKINWYAILFYAVIIVGLAWYYLHLRRQPEDQDGDGFVDANKIVTKKKMTTKR